MTMRRVERPGAVLTWWAPWALLYRTAEAGSAESEQPQDQQDCSRGHGRYIGEESSSALLDSLYTIPLARYSL